MRQRISTGSQYEKELGYSRAVRVGDTIYVSGCSGLRHIPDTPEGSAAEQFRIAAGKLRQTLEKAGAHLDDVVMTRTYLTRPDDWPEVGRAHGEVFGDICPASTMVQVSRLIDEAMVIEIEAIAIRKENGSAKPDA
jgi:enamine deaminase RidA (YjgF/YER057c/UK114 family)